MLRHAPRSKLTAFRDGIILFLKLVMSDEPYLGISRRDVSGGHAAVRDDAAGVLLWKFLFLI